MRKYLEHYRAKPVPAGFCYSSGANAEWLSVDQLRASIRRHVDPTFSA
jgi:hypothetical protein